MASIPDILDERPWAPTSPGMIRIVRAQRRARWALLLAPLLVLALIAIGALVWSLGGEAPAPPPQATATPAVIDAPFAPAALRPLSVLEAEKWNRTVPKAAGAIAAATPFAIGLGDATSFARSLQCMTAAIYYEAGNEPLDGQRAVAQVVLNRMRSPVYPHSVCAVIYQGSERKTGCQFTFTCDGSLARVPAPASWARAGAVAAAALGGSVYAPVGWATNYHADYVVPYWAQSLAKLATIGRHIFYGWNGQNGTAAGFTSRYAGIEPEVAPGLSVAVAEAGTKPVDPGAVVEVSSAERPIIDFAGQDTATDQGKTPGRSGGNAAEVQHPVVGLGSRWIIGNPGSSEAGAAKAAPKDAHVAKGEAAGAAKKGDAAAKPWIAPQWRGL